MCMNKCGKHREIKTLLLAVVLTTVLLVCAGCGGKKTITTSQFQKAINVQDLSVAEFTYNGVAEYQHNGKMIYIKYGSKVKAGIDFHDVEFNVIPKDKVIEITLPEIRITDVSIDASKIDYIPASPDIQMQEVLRACKNDVLHHASVETTFFQTASNNLKSTITALIRPLISQDDYTIHFYGTKVQRTTEVIE